MKWVGKAVTFVYHAEKDYPVSVSGRPVRRVLDFWFYGGRWWEGESPRSYWLLEMETGKVIEVYREDNTGKGVCSRIAD